MEKQKKWTEMEYPVHNDADVLHKYVKKINTDQFKSLPYCGLNTKPHGVRGFSRHYHL